ncbi:fumarylacetoacetate hydrolase family protein [Bacillus luteolus]|uniref:Fumarylacetoacetate hydrolase family protein n=1 Tax=Litchfieldia luteola TaxID=682179 RepID=A0ABR9QLE3_9BACI|nr:fumarylacetoacetate hydrolase family protein [Cytobacillus luteolus]MBE4909302.1 fumarylacetoacetate hydrolase family protein [Cytobacillus luteolus]MBP1940696.1 2-keto-4-pentenoate hydratase/2-oxohepta-3-ene-1,7-dioic acid hydratase in catechol pathway [Cytobacillus luteolus]
MRFVTAQKGEQTIIGIMIQDGSKVLDLHEAEKAMNSHSTLPRTMNECLDLGDLFIEKVSAIEEWASGHNDGDYIIELAEVVLKAPIPRPRKNVFCVGKNYADHAIEMGSAADIPEHVMLFSKAPTSVVGTEETILHHDHVTRQLDYEGELAVIIGKKGKRIAEEDAFDYVFGYTILNDITARDLQDKHKQFLLGKSLDTSCPMGPYIAHKSIIPNPANLRIETKVNGEVRQSGNTDQFIFSIEKIISVISQGTTLEPGDIIATGTPAGVGKGFKPPRFLNKGDEIEISVEGLGTLKNTIEQ